MLQPTLTFVMEKDICKVGRHKSSIFVMLLDHQTDTDPMAVKEVNRILINEEDNEEGFSQEDTIRHSAS